MFDAIRPCIAGLVLLRPQRLNDYSGLPNKLFDFMGCGLAVFAGDVPEMVRIVGEEQCGWLVDSEDHLSLASAMTELLEDRTEATGRGARGRRAVLRKYNWAIAERNLLELYERLST
jgi:glycosyltransferase involved in cell wall biosynthesis